MPYNKQLSLWPPFEVPVHRDINKRPTKFNINTQAYARKLQVSYNFYCTGNLLTFKINASLFLSPLFHNNIVWLYSVGMKNYCAKRS